MNQSPLITTNFNNNGPFIIAHGRSLVALPHWLRGKLIDGYEFDNNSTINLIQKCKSDEGKDRRSIRGSIVITDRALVEDTEAILSKFMDKVSS